MTSLGLVAHLVSMELIQMKKQNLSQPSICWQQPCLAPSCRPCRRGVASNTSSSSNRKSTRKLGCNIILKLNCRMKWMNLRGAGGILHGHCVFVRSSALNVQLVNSSLRAANFMQQLPFGHADPCCSDCQRQGIWLQVLWISEVPLEEPEWPSAIQEQTPCS